MEDTEKYRTPGRDAEDENEYLTAENTEESSIHVHLKFSCFGVFPTPREVKLAVDRKALNVVLLGLGFFLLFFSFNTTSSFETSVNGRYSLFLAAFVYAIYVACNIYVIGWVLIAASASIGIAAAILWCAQGSYISKNSTPHTISLNSGIFFALFALNSVAGNVFAGTLKSLNIDNTILFSVFAAIAALAALSFLLLRKPKENNQKVQKDIPLKAMLLETLSLFFDRRMQFLVFCWAGALSLMVASFPEKVYLFGPLSKLHGWKFPFKSVRNPWFILHSFPAIAGALSNTLNFWVMSVWGGASVLGSVAFGRLERYIPRSTLIIYAGLVHVIALPLSVCTYQYGNLNPGRVWLFYCTAVFLGLGDAGNNTMIYSVVSTFYCKESEPAFAFFRLIQSSASAVAYVYGNFLSVPWLVIILFPSLLLGQLFVYFLHQYVAAVDAPLQMQPAA